MKYKVAVFIPAYRRPEYTRFCLESIKKAQGYDNCVFYFVNDGGNDGIFEEYAREQDVVVNHTENIGLRNTIIEFFEWVKDKDFDFLSKVDNDCVVPEYWLDDLVRILVDADAEIISPNVSETNAAIKYGHLKHKIAGFIPSKIVGGVWTMKKSLIEDMSFERIGINGIRGAFNIINQIIVDKAPKVGWTTEVTFEDVGYWAGTHPLHIKSVEHAVYSAEIGRPVSWSPDGGQDAISQGTNREGEVSPESQEVHGEAK
jgi:glycosyltransferase involved in cell wall biosynthesis